MVDPKTCKHFDFMCSATVNRLTENDGKTVVAYAVELKVECSDCHQPFRFLVPRVGMIPSDAAVSPTGEELRVYAVPSDGSLQMGDVKGFVIRKRPEQSAN